ncbi:tyrosine recombinase XerC [Mycobacterium heckeshornense]|uniref:tyrosine-type recombinase/integrase n=1 Tax=Mycobacterium heckeshornense TaxID=110505 RepID=UPI001945B328|nr:site-specific integrase [Mycobacterium heckeshornense]BCQ06760.1 tyrosine recombinase XerC [Mycobacterium heckeshornense]
MPASVVVDDSWLVEDYLAAMRASGHKTGRSTTRSAYTCEGKIRRAGGWDGLTAEQRLDVVVKARSFTSWLMVTGRITVDAELLSRTDLRPGLPARSFCPADYHWFNEACSRIGVSARDTAAQWNILAKVTAITGVSPRAITDEHFDAARVAMLTAYARRGKPTAGKNVAAVFHRLRLTLFHAGQVSTLRPPAVQHQSSDTGWDTAPIKFVETAQRYLAQVALSLRPSTVRHIDLDLRRFGIWLADTHPDVTGCADLRREHIEAFKAWLCTHARPSTGKPLNRVSIKNTLINLHCFLTRIAEWGYPDAPTRALMFPGDLPIIDKPLPRFLDDAAAAKLLRATRSEADPLSRLIVELLARTGIRRSELLALTVDAVVQIGSAYWLRIPIGKLHNDRYIPLHPQLKELLDDWIANHRPNGLRTNHLLIEHRRPISHHRVTSALRRVAGAAGIGNVTAHQLRHTLATQAVNRGMSLDAIAALLGHKTLAMTMVYARIADKTVAEEYFAVTEKVELLYGQPHQLAGDDEGREMRKLRNEMHRRMLGNGYCARPVEMDCHFESICESCSFFVTTLEFRPTLQRQRDDAANKGQLGRQKIFDGILDRLDTTAS